MGKGDRQGRNDRPVTLILVAVAILVTLYIRRLRSPAVSKQVQTDRIIHSELMTPTQMIQEGKARGVEVNISSPLTREQFESFIAPSRGKAAIR